METPRAGLRKININIIFREPLDLLIILLGGMQAPLLCREALNIVMEPYPFMTDMDASIRDQIHIPKEYWFDIAASFERRKTAIINGCQATVSLAFEKLRDHPRYNSIKNEAFVRMLGHLRNAGSHGNKFWFKNPKGDFIDPGIIEWNEKIIKKSLHGNQNVFPDFFSPGDIIHLFDDISKALK